MPKFQIERRHGNIGLFVLVTLIYVTLLLLFAWQTLLFVGILFPDSDLLMKILTVFSIDGMGFVWACLHTFYRFAHPYAKKAVQIGWVITYLLSALVSVLYLILTYMFDFQHVTDLTTIQIGVGASIGALIFNLAMLSAFLYFEIATRFPNEDDFEIVGEVRHKGARAAAPVSVTPEPSALPKSDGMQCALHPDSAAIAHYRGIPYCQTCFNALAVTLARPPALAGEDVPRLAPPRTPVPEVTGQLEAVKPPDPFAQSPLEIPTRPTGSQNGHS